jgi:hypothetical protein
MDVDVNNAELKKIISQSPTKSCELDPLPTSSDPEKCYRHPPPSLVIVSIINKSLRTAIVPDSMKVALVTPLIKKNVVRSGGICKLPPEATFFPI